MGATALNETMRRKPILMPPKMIAKIDRIARDRKISFAEVVREAVNAFSGDAAAEDDALLEALAETMIRTTQHVVERMDAVEQRLDETHALLEES
ncbi:hypothetical protein DESC_750039 [Desulfosarcina cetonica]|uniref:ribbon-helix-helix protein, CopG family n=1 Tax=Desulfosarcina cetonica TaxID=90730 RepID=UPI0006D03ECE|nr:ribbon-helix-helix protein, CopG family [Desulfosarcina cetonica]VTR69574.1 hypothetical protein DESC_750039 [Desulfosarcina cetonica]